MLKAIIVEDEPNSIEILEFILKDYSEITIVGIANNYQDADQLINDKIPDLIFLDLLLPDGHGTDLMQKYQQFNTSMKFFVISAHLEKYLLEVTDRYSYALLKKPLDKRVIHRHLQDIIQQNTAIKTSENIELFSENVKYFNNQNHRFTIKTGEGFEVVRVQDIIYCKSRKNGCFLFLLDSIKHDESTYCKVPSMTIKDLQELFIDFGFIRIDQGYLVNRYHVVKYIRADQLVLMSNGSKLGVSRGEKKRFEESFLQFFTAISSKNKK